MKTKTLWFEAAPGKTVVFPRSVIAGANQSNVRLRGKDTPIRVLDDKGNDTLELELHPGDAPIEVKRCRFVTMRINAGDGCEVPAPRSGPVAKPAAPVAESKPTPTPTR